MEGDKAETLFTYKEIYECWKEWSPEHAAMAIDYRPWGRHSIVVWLKNGYAYKVKYISPGRFVMQTLTKKDIDRKFGLEEG